MTGPGRVIGHAAGSLSNAGSWTDQGRASVGSRGELNTATVLHTLAAAENGPTVIHDLRIPLPGVKANIDHLVISGNTVTVLDSKMWKPGFYWTIAGRSFRGFSRFPAADKRTIPMAVDALTAHLSKLGVRHRMGRPLLVVWPSSRTKTLSVAFLASPGARAVHADVFKAATRSFVGGKPADPALVNALAQLAIAS